MLLSRIWHSLGAPLPSSKLLVSAGAESLFTLRLCFLARGEGRGARCGWNRPSREPPATSLAQPGLGSGYCVSSSPSRLPQMLSSGLDQRA